MRSSDRISPEAFSPSIRLLILWRTASAEWAAVPSDEAMAAVKKNFSSNTPRGVAIYLLVVTRDTVDSCIPTASATVLRFSGRKYSTP